MSCYCVCTDWEIKYVWTNNNVLNIFYVNLKLTFGYESYLSTISAFTTRRYLTRMRISADRLRINSGRFRERIPRRCQLCNQSVPVNLEDEFHFILKCQCFTDLRKIYISRFFRGHPSVFKFLKILNSTNKRALTILFSYIKFATERRDALLLNINYM